MKKRKTLRGVKLRWPGILAIGALLGLAGGLLYSADRVRAADDRVALLEAQMQQLNERVEDLERAPIANWHTLKATGAPDCVPPLDRDSENAWAPATENGGIEWLLLDYAVPQVATSVRIHEVCSAGALSRVELLDEQGTWHEVWDYAKQPVDELTDPRRPAGVFEVAFQETDYRVSQVRLQLDTRRVSGWNEIDAVELVGPNARAWASHASASSSYATGVNTVTIEEIPPRIWIR